MAQLYDHRADRIVGCGAALAVLATVLFLPAVLNDADTYWHIAAGQWMLDHRALLLRDPFSYTFAGKPWQAHEWLSEILMALAYRAGAWPGVVVLFGAAAVLAMGLLADHVARHLHGLGLCVALVLAFACLSGSLLARPHLLVLPILELWVAALLHALSSRRPPSLLLAAWIALWANLHASFMIGLAFIIPIAAAAIAREVHERAAMLKGWALFAAASLVASLATPYGVDGLLFPFRLMSMPSLSGIGEWQPTDLGHLQPTTLAMGATAYVLLTRGIRLERFRAAILLGLCYLAFAHVRHQVLLAIVAPLVLAEPIGQSLYARGIASAVPSFPGRSIALASACAIAAVLIGARLFIPLGRADGIATPATAFARVPEQIAREPVLNDYAFGGFLIFNRTRPFIDSRAELYGESFLERYAALTRPDTRALTQTLSEYSVRWTIFAPGNPAVAAMDKLSGWKRLYADRWAVVHVRAR